MSTDPQPLQASVTTYLDELDVIKRSGGWFLGLGIILLILGIASLGYTFWVAELAAVVFGWLLIVGGVMEAIHAFWRERGWSGFFLNLFAGILYVVVGFMVVANPAAGVATLTLLIAMFLIFNGIFRIVVSGSVRHPNWGWVLLHGLVNLALGVLIWRQWPLSGLYVIGLFIGIEMIINGWSLIMLGLVAKKASAAIPAAQDPA